MPENNQQDKPNKPRILAIILARGGSKGVPRKNIRPLGGLPLLGHTLRAAHDAKDVLSRVVVSTEDKEIAEAARQLGAEVIDRPLEFAQDHSKSEEALTHALGVAESQGERFDAVMLLSPTCPFRNAGHIRQAVSVHLKGDFDTVVSLQPVYKYSYDYDTSGRARPKYSIRANRQERDAVYLENGALYLCRAELVRQGKIFGQAEKTGGVLMDQESSINIDEPIDFDIAETVIKHRNDL